MFVQILIYVYLGICAGMILFNIATALLSQRREHRSFRDGIRLELTVSQELDRLAETGAVSERHLRFMERRLRRVNGMAAFDAALECLCVRRPELTRSYLTALNGVMIALAEDYCRRDEIEAAYFPYIIRKYRLLDGQENEALKTMLLDLLHESSIYCRENAMQALYTAGALIVFARKKRAEQKANALIDPRYGIGNDGYYLNCMETLIPAPLRSIVYVFCIGCDMPSLERRFGEAEREEIFSRAAEYLRLGCGREEYLACVGRGMFALVCQCGSREAAQQRAEGLIRGLDGYLAGFRAEYAGAFRAGICSLSENPDCDAEAALYNARQGCAHAFRTETPCAFSTRGMIDESEQLERLRGSMSKAVEKGEFEPYLQFVVDRAGTVVGAEAVSRWQNPEEGLLKPSKYIDLMIRAGTITELDLYMLRCACVQLQTWKREGRGTLWLSCNFTRQSIADEKILARVREIIEQYDFTRDRLVVELTEDSYAHDRETALRTIEGLHAMGLRIVLDDIGAGYSSLSDLSTYPIDGVKIDRSIVIESALPRARALLEGMIRLSHDMGIRVLCEGVEDKATCDAVLAAGCDFIQGFYFSRVLPGREAESFLRSLAARDREEG